MIKHKLFRPSIVSVFILCCCIGTIGYFRVIAILFQTIGLQLVYDDNEYANVATDSNTEKATTNPLHHNYNNREGKATKFKLDRNRAESIASTSPKRQQQPVLPWASIANGRDTINHMNNDFLHSQTTMRKKKRVPRSTTEFGSSYIYQRGPWDGAPVVIESHHLIFFTTPKIGCTVFKMLFQRMMNIPHWSNATNSDRIHDPDQNGLRYLYDYPESTAQSMLTSHNWTKAVFVRDPKTRLLSAFLDKAINTDYMLRHCCRHFRMTNHVIPCREGFNSRNITFADFVFGVIPKCRDPHWEAQANRIPQKYWPHIDFIGHMESIAADTKRLLEMVGAWNTYGANGWHGGSIFADTVVSHATDSSTRLREYYTPELETAVEEFYKKDYEHPLLNLTRIRIFPK